jgi:lysine 2,3-aminomutase
MKAQVMPTKDAAEKPPSITAAVAEEEEPPLKAAVATHSLFCNTLSERWNDWRWHFRNRITTVESLSKYIPLSTHERAQMRLVSIKYPLAITPYYLSLMHPNDPFDPIRTQALPSIEELSKSCVSMEDPLAEEEHSVVPGLVHRYPDRVLMVLTDICPMLCRHCTRKREWRHGGWVRTPEQLKAMLAYIRQHKEIRDVVVSGGDPLTWSTARLEEVLSGLRNIPHVEIIRIGTRMPVVLPQRIDDELCNMLSKYGPIWLNTHFNHPHEITPEAALACDRLLRAGVPVNNQSVLLKGINDSVETQVKLCQGLLRIKVRPYYLFQCDDVAGTEHFWTPVETGVNIIQGMRGFTSGLAIPTYVIDLPNGGGKIPVGPDYILERTPEELVVRNYQGKIIHYSNPGNPKTFTKHIDVMCEEIIPV